MRFHVWLSHAVNKIQKIEGRGSGNHTVNRSPFLRPFLFGGNMKKIKLTQGQFALVDDEDYERVNKYKWTASYSKQSNSYVALRGIKKSLGKRKHVLMHRFIMNAPKGRVVDHIHHNTLDNRKQELRTCTQSQNCMNARKTPSKSSKYKGVSWHKTIKAWFAHIYIDGRNKYIGYYKTENQAALAYNKAALKYFGEYSYLNEVA